MEKQVSAMIPTKWGDFKMALFSNDMDDPNPHFALIHKDCHKNFPIVVRIHSECITGDLLGSRKCDCGEQLDLSMQIINERRGMLIYLRQEGRGIGIVNKLKAYNLQDKGMNTIDANTHLGFEPDERHYNLAIDILKILEIHQIELITNNPDKIQAIEDSPIELVGRIPIIAKTRMENKKYLQVKKDLLGHFLDG